MIRRLGIICPFLITLMGCGMDYKCKVTSDTNWVATFADQRITGYHSRVFGLDADKPICVTVKKTTSQGHLMIELFKEGGWIFIADDRNSPISTTADFGVVSDCID